MLAVSAGCDLPGKPNPDERPLSPDQIMDFDKLFSTNCAGCHGAGGELGPAPPLNDPLFALIVSDAELTQVINDGRSRTPMPAFSHNNGGPLTDAQVKVLVDGIKAHAASMDATEPAPPQYALTKGAGVQSTPGSRERGAEVFARACAGCHGPNGAGGERDGAIGGAINVPAFLALISDQAIRRIIITGRPDLYMPSYSEQTGRPDDFQPLTSAEIDDLVALLADWRATGSVARTNEQ